MGDKEVMAIAVDMGEGLHCSDHPYRNNPGGICAFCLQEKLGKLVSSSNGSTPFLSIPPAAPSSSSSSPSFRSDYGAVGPAAGCGTGVSGGRTKAPFLAAAQKKKNTAASASTAAASSNNGNVAALKRSKSVAPRPMGAISDATTADSPRKKGFWSFLYLSSSSSSATSSSSNKRRSTSSGSDNGGSDMKQQQQEHRREAVAPTKPCVNGGKEDQEAAVGESPVGSQASSGSFGRKVARSRSVGCGSRSFSGDFLERISTGFGDCTLRRVESHRESSKHNNKMMLHHRDGDQEERIKERMKCGGIFGGFGMISSSSTYWLSAAATAAAAGEDAFDTGNSRSGSNTARASTSAAIIRGRGGRSKSWGWAFASRMRAFRPATTSKSHAPTSTIGGGGKMSNGEGGAKPSLLAVGS